MNKSREIFEAIPKTHNCAQSVAAGSGAAERCGELAACGGGRAPGGLCGALHAALLLTPEETHEALCREFEDVAGSTLCREIKAIHHVPCAECEELGGKLVEKFRK